MEVSLKEPNSDLGGTQIPRRKSTLNGRVILGQAESCRGEYILKFICKGSSDMARSLSLVGLVLQQLAIHNN